MRSADERDIRLLAVVVQCFCRQRSALAACPPHHNMPTACRRRHARRHRMPGVQDMHAIDSAARASSACAPCQALRDRVWCYMREGKEIVEKRESVLRR